MLRILLTLVHLMRLKTPRKFGFSAFTSHVLIFNYDRVVLCVVAVRLDVILHRLPMNGFVLLENQILVLSENASIFLLIFVSLIGT